MNLSEFDRLMKRAHELRNESKGALLNADKVENEALARAGIKHVSREPGFPCWTIDGLPGYFYDPRSALEAKEKAAKEVNYRQIVERLCEIHKCTPEHLIQKATLSRIMDGAFCDKPEDRLYHHSDQTWWKRDAQGDLVRAEPPQGWRKSSWE